MPRKAVAQPAKSISSPSPTSSQLPASSPFTNVPPLLRRSVSVQSPAPSRCREACIRETVGSVSTMSAERARPTMHSQWFTGCSVPFRSTI